MLLSEILAVGAALCIAVSGMLSAELRNHVGVLTLTLWQATTAALLTGSVALALGQWAGIQPWHLWYLAGSGLFGILLASNALNASIFALGTRNAALVFSLNAPFAAWLGYLVLGETLSAGQAAGIALVVAGVAMAVLFGGTDAAPAAATAARLVRSRPAGVGLGVIAAFCQACGTLVARPVMADHVGPFAAMAVRAGFSATVLIALCGTRQARHLWPRGAVEPWRPRFTWRHLAIGVSGACIGTGLGMSLLMAALAHGGVGIVSTLSSLVPVLVLPMVWARTGRRPRWQAWMGAALAVAGTGAIALG